MPSMTRLALLPLILSLAACQALPTRSEAPPTAPVAAVDAGPAANDGLNALVWMQTSAEYRLVAGETWRSALAPLDKAIKTPDWDALAPDERDRPARGLPMAVIVDVDETVLDNSPYQARQLLAGKGFDDVSWKQWIDEQAAAAVPGALEFARAAAARGVTIYYLSNRTVDQGAATIANLRKLGFPLADDSQFLGLGTVVEGCEDSGSEKGCRRRLIGQTHRVLMQFGDQLGDLVNVLVNTSEGREQAIKPYLGWIGERWFVLPNPSYGSWEPALFNNDWSQPELERRRQKEAALRTGVQP